LSERGDQEQGALRKQIAVLEEALLSDVGAADRQRVRRVPQSAWGRAHT
jgi:hypothetical protein